MIKIVLFAFCSVILISCAHKHGKGHRYRHHKHMWKKMDANGDGKVSRKEFDDLHSKHFKEMDANKDGFITKEEKKAWKKNRKKKSSCSKCEKGKCECG